MNGSKRTFPIPKIQNHMTQHSECKGPFPFLVFLGVPKLHVPPTARHFKPLRVPTLYSPAQRNDFDNKYAIQTIKPNKQCNGANQ